MNENDFEIVYTKTIRLKNGRVLHASAYGLKAFRLRFKKNKRKKKGDASCGPKKN